MPPAPLITALLAAASTAAGLAHLALDPSPYDPGRALLVGVGMAMAGLVVTAGVLLARGRWSRWSALALAVAWALLAARDPLDPGTVAVLVLAAAVVTLAAGPWLPRWLRHRPSAEGPPPAAVVLLLSLLAVPPVVGVSSSGEVAPLEWLGAGWALGLAFGISRAWAAALWAARLGHAPVMIATAWASGLPGATWVAALAVFQVALSWRRDVHLAVSPLIPEESATTPFPPELVDPRVLRAAGLDSRGRPLEETD